VNTLQALLKRYSGKLLAIGCVCIGLLLMCVTLAHNVNPCEGSVVSDAIRGTRLHDLLLVTTIPACVAGMFAVGLLGWLLNFLIPADWLRGPLGLLFVPSMFGFQALSYWLLAKAIGLMYRRSRWVCNHAVAAAGMTAGVVVAVLAWTLLCIRADFRGAHVVGCVLALVVLVVALWLMAELGSLAYRGFKKVWPR